MTNLIIVSFILFFLSKLILNVKPYYETDKKSEVLLEDQLVALQEDNFSYNFKFKINYNTHILILFNPTLNSKFA